MYLISGTHHLCERKEYVFNVLEYSIITLVPHAPNPEELPAACRYPLRNYSVQQVNHIIRPPAQ